MKLNNYWRLFWLLVIVLVISFGAILVLRTADQSYLVYIPRVYSSATGYQLRDQIIIHDPDSKIYKAFDLPASGHSVKFSSSNNKVYYLSLEDQKSLYADKLHSLVLAEGGQSELIFSSKALLLPQPQIKDYLISTNGDVFFLNGGCADLAVEKCNLLKYSPRDKKVEIILPLSALRSYFDFFGADLSLVNYDESHGVIILRYSYAFEGRPSRTALYEINIVNGGIVVVDNPPQSSIASQCGSWTINVTGDGFEIKSDSTSEEFNGTYLGCFID